MKDPKGISVSIMGREFRVAAPEGEERQLIASVEYLNKKMKEIRDAGKIVGNERIAIMAALNIAHEHLQSSSGKPAKTSAHSSIDEAFVKRKMEAFESIIEKAVSDQEKLF
jgi:cell division protein ZapA